MTRQHDHIKWLHNVYLLSVSTPLNNLPMYRQIKSFAKVFNLNCQIIPYEIVHASELYYVCLNYKTGFIRILRKTATTTTKTATIFCIIHCVKQDCLLRDTCYVKCIRGTVVAHPWKLRRKHYPHQVSTKHRSLMCTPLCRKSRASI